MPTCVPIRDLKDTARFTAFVESSAEPVTVTRNGRDAMVVMTPAMYEGIRQQLSRERLYRIIDRAEGQISKGEHIDSESFFHSMRERYGV